MSSWRVEYFSDDFERFYLRLPAYEQAVVTAAITHVLEAHGIDAFDGGWGKPLGGGLYEFRVQRSLDAILSLAGVAPSQSETMGRQVSLRVFCTSRRSDRPSVPRLQQGQRPVEATSAQGDRQGAQSPDCVEA